jgi:hypothetical protein
MTKKKGDKNINNPLTQGVPSKVYLLAFGGKLHKYRIKQIIKYGWDSYGQRVNSNDIHRIVKDYPSYFYQDIENKYVEKGRIIIPIKTYADPLINQMEKEIDEIFDENTRNKLLDFFNSNDFRNYIYNYSINQAKKGYFNNDVDSFGSIMVMTSYFSRLAFQLRKTLDRRKVPLETFKKNWNKISKKLERSGMSEDIILSTISEYSPSDVKDKFPNKLSDLKLMLNLCFKMTDLNYSVLEKLMKMHYTYETLTIVDASLMAIPELVDMVKSKQ